MKEEEKINSHQSLLKRVKNRFLSLDENIFDKRILIATSAGPDSTCLLYLCCRLFNPDQLKAVYIDHQLRPEEVTTEIGMLQKLCSELNVSFGTEQVDVKKYAGKYKLSTEEAARKLRHRALENLRHEFNCDYIALGHTEDDQIEEFFIRVVRGSNTAGLAGIKPLRDNLIRPLLQETKNSLLSYLKKKEISFSTDSSNSDYRFLRNRVRHDLIPHLKKNYNDSIEQSILHFNAIFSEEENYLDSIVVNWLRQNSYREQSDINRVSDSKISLPISLFNLLHLAIQRRVIEKTILKMGGRPSFATISSAITLFTDGKRGDEIHLKGGLRIIRQEDVVMFHYLSDKYEKRDSCKRKDKLEDVVISQPGTFGLQGSDYVIELAVQESSPQPGKEALVLDYDKITFPLLLREPIPGERFRPFGFGGTKKVNRFFNERKLANDCLRLCLVQNSNNEIIALPGVEISDLYKTEDATKRYLVLTIRDKTI